MIVKIKTHKRPIFEQILQYMMNDKDRLNDKSGGSFLITHNLKGKNISDWARQFKENELCRLRRRKDNVLINHEIISWHKDDAKNITPSKLEEMVRQYITLRNPKGMYVAVPHFDKDHYHIHICTSGVEYKSGKSMRLSKQNLQTLKKDIQNYQREHFPELSNSIVAHGKKEKVRTTDKEYQYKQRTGRETDKEQIIGMLKTCYKKAESRYDFYTLLKECGLSTYDRSGKKTGVIFKNQKFRFKRLGFTEERLEELTKLEQRGIGLKKVRSKESKKVLER